MTLKSLEVVLGKPSKRRIGEKFIGAPKIGPKIGPNLSVLCERGNSCKHQAIETKVNRRPTTNDGRPTTDGVSLDSIAGKSSSLITQFSLDLMRLIDLIRMKRLYIAHHHVGRSIDQSTVNFFFKRFSQLGATGVVCAGSCLCLQVQDDDDFR